MRKTLMVNSVFLLLIVFSGAVAAGVQPNVEEYQTKYPDAHSITLQEETSFDVAADGTYIYNYHLKNLILTQNGIDQESTFEEGYYKLYDTVEIEEAQVVHPDGTVVPVDEENIKDIPMPAFGPFFMENIRMIIVTFPNLSPGCITEIRVKGSRNAPPMDDVFSYTTALHTFKPVLSSLLTIMAPESMNLQWKVYRGDIEFGQKEMEDKTAYTWTVEDAPQVIWESGMPSFMEVVPVLTVTTIDSWKTISSWYHDLCLKDAEITGELRAVIEEAVKGAGTTAEKIEGCFYWVSENIRYVETAMTGEKAGFKPDPPSVILHNRYGVCRDKAHLLACMLREIGIEAAETLITAGTKIDVDLPTLNFNHAITAVRDAEGEWYFIDPTVEDSKDFLASSDQDKWALICTKEGEDITLTPLLPPENNICRVRLQNKLDDQGNLTGSVEWTMAGMADFFARSFLKRMPPMKREEMIKRMIREISPHAEVVSMDVSDPEDMSRYMRIAIEYSAPDFAVSAGKYLILPITAHEASFDFLAGFIFWGTDLTDRKYPLHIGSTYLSVIDEQLELPKGYQVKSIPENRKIEHQNMALLVDYAHEGDVFNFHKEMRVADTYFEGESFKNLVDLLTQNEHMSEGKIICVQ